MIDIVITADYEIFGNGTGDVQCCLLDPTEELLSICDEFGARLTLFFEICEYWAFIETRGDGPRARSIRRDGRRMMAQAAAAVSRGHDVQLHAHPQWLNASHTSDGWVLDYDLWRLPDMPRGLGEIGDILSLRGLLHKGKHDLEAELAPHARGYECVALRAGGWCIQPSREVFRAMREVGLVVDSSVYKGGHALEKPFQLDFRDAHDHCLPWRADPLDVNRVVDETDPFAVIEMPIYSRVKRRIFRAGPSRFYRDWFGPTPRPPGCAESGYAPAAGKTGRAPWRMAARLLEPVVFQWDFCTLGAGEMLRFLADFKKRGLPRSGYYPLIMIGHPKSFNNGAAFRGFLKRVAASREHRRGEVRFATLQQAAARYARANPSGGRPADSVRRSPATERPPSEM